MGGVMKDFGIYALIFHTDHGEKIYIGSTIQPFRKRIERHFRDFRNLKHCNPYMQSLFTKYGFPELRILESNPDKDTIREREQWHIDQTQKDVLVNFGPALPNPMSGTHRSKEVREKISRAHKGRPISPELLKALIGRKVSAETRAKISASEKGKYVSLATREKTSKSKKGKKPNRIYLPMTEEHKEKLRRINTGRHLSPETIEKRSKAMLGHIVTEETRRKISQAKKGKSWSRARREAQAGGKHGISG